MEHRQRLAEEGNSQSEAFEPKILLDIATGTGDFAILAAQMLHPDKLIGADISEGMMAIGREKVKTAGLQQVISFEKEDCTNLSYPEATFDAVIAAFGIRNFANLDKGLAEMCRVLKPGGTPEHRGTDITRQFSDEAAIPHLQPHRATYLRTAHIQRHQCLQLSHQDH